MTIPTPSNYSSIQGCRVCGASALERVLDLGWTFVSTFSSPGSEEPPPPSAPLCLVQCTGCQTVQLADTVRPDLLFQRDYWYASGINSMMREELRNVVREARAWVQIHDGDWVLDIGANDGTLCHAWHDHLWEGRPYRMAVEPSPTFDRALRDRCEVRIMELFPSRALQGSPGQFKAITSIAMFYAVPDPVAFADAVRYLLHPEGVWVVQMQDLQSMVRATAFDNICHEHLMYYSVQTFWEVCRRAGLRIVSYAPREINGGSLRFIVQHAGNGENPCPALLTQDQQPVHWDAFDGNMAIRLQRLQDMVAAAQDVGHIVDLLGASTKGNTLLQLAGLGPAQIRQCWERHPGKIGRRTITNIPIVHEEAGRQAPPNLLVCPIWQFRQGLVEREAAFLQNGGRMYFPLPHGELYFGKKENA